MASGNMTPSWLNAGGGASGGGGSTANPFSSNSNQPSWCTPGLGNDGNEPSWCRPSGGATDQPGWAQPRPAEAAPTTQPAPAEAPSKKKTGGWFTKKHLEVTTIAIDGADLRTAPPDKKNARGSTKRADKEEKCCPQYRWHILLGCLAAAILFDALAMFRLRSNDITGFGILFFISFTANMSMMLVFFGPMKYLKGLFTPKRLITTVCFYGLTALVIALCFVDGVPIIWIILLFLGQQIAWGFNLAAGFGCTPCALPEKDTGSEPGRQ